MSSFDKVWYQACLRYPARSTRWAVRCFPAWEERVPRSDGLVYAPSVSFWISCRLAVGTELDIFLVAIVRNRNHHDQVWLTASGRGLGEGLRWLFTIFPKVDFFTCRWIRAIFVLTFSPSGENVNTNMALIHRQVKKRNIPFYIKNDMGPNDSLTDGRESYDCDEKYYIKK